MGTGANGLTLESLAQKLEAQTQRLATLERENAELRGKVATLEGSGTPRGEVPALRGSESRRETESETTESEALVSRRSLLSNAGAAAVAAVAAGTLLNPREAKADHATNHIKANTVEAHFVRGDRTDNFVPAVTGVNRGSYAGMEGINTVGGEGVRGKAKNGTGVFGTGVIGVWGTSFTAGEAAVYAEHFGTAGPGVVGDGLGANFAGVWGRNPSGTGVQGEGSTQAEVAGVRGIGKTGMWGSSATTGYSGVYGQHTGTSGYGVVGDGKGESGAGVLGRNPGGTGIHGQSSKTGYGGVTAEHTGSSGYGVIGLGKGSGSGVLGRNSSGIGVLGEGTNGVHGKATGGYGGLFEGGKAQLKITPKGSAGRPTAGAHVKGELYMDSAANLFVCTVSGTPGTWRRVQTVVA